MSMRTATPLPLLLVALTALLVAGGEDPAAGLPGAPDGLATR